MTADLRAGLCLALTLALAGCATTGPATAGDPLERMNRGTYRFNAAIDRAVLRPVATGYRNGVPRVVRTGIGNVLSNLAFPTTIINDLLQFKLKDAAIDLGRFAINSTLGIGGLLDPASHFGIPRNNEDFGQTLGRWGVPAGPYVVLPLFGPSTLRDAPSMLADAQTDLRVQLDLETDEKVALGVLTVMDRRAELLSIDQSIEAAYDPYAFVRNAWLQRREYQVRDGEVPDDPPPEDLEDPELLEDPEDQPAPDAVAGSSSETSLMPASAASPAGMLR
ncbi:MAG: VacJ family lipoprotein [Steroidobacteraceae bacterium]